MYNQVCLVLVLPVAPPGANHVGNSAHIAPEIHLAWHQLRIQDVVFDFSKQPTFELGILG